jgi:hypothetical protein
LRRWLRENPQPKLPPKRSQALGLLRPSAPGLWRFGRDVLTFSLVFQGTAVDEAIFERWKESRKRRRKTGMGRLGVVLIVFFTAVAAAISFGIVFAAVPSKLVASVQGQVVPNEHEWDDEDIDEEAREWMKRHVTVKLDNGEKTGIDLPKGEEVRADALIKLDVYRKALGPVTMEFHKFAGYVDTAK